jgi:hypothetical protein
VLPLPKQKLSRLTANFLTRRVVDDGRIEAGGRTKNLAD